MASALVPDPSTTCTPPVSITVGSQTIEVLPASCPPGVPVGAVMAFDLPGCPTGWTTFAPAAGRTVIGVGAGAGLTPRSLGDTGGEERHTLTVGEMPSHTHVEMIPQPQSSTVVAASASDAAGGSRYSVQPSAGAQDGGDLLTGSTGGGQSHNVMQPFVALLYCKKL